MGQKNTSALENGDMDTNHRKNKKIQCNFSEWLEPALFIFKLNGTEFKLRDPESIFISTKIADRIKLINDNTEKSAFSRVFTDIYVAKIKLVFHYNPLPCQVLVSILNGLKVIRSKSLLFHISSRMDNFVDVVATFNERVRTINNYQNRIQLVLPSGRIISKGPESDSSCNNINFYSNTTTSSIEPLLRYCSLIGAIWKSRLAPGELDLNLNSNEDSSYEQLFLGDHIANCMKDITVLMCKNRPILKTNGNTTIIDPIYLHLNNYSQEMEYSAPHNFYNVAIFYIAIINTLLDFNIFKFQLTKPISYDLAYGYYHLTRDETKKMNANIVVNTDYHFMVVDITKF